MSFLTNLRLIAKQLLKEKSFLFWVVMYPFLFTTMMYAGLSNLLQEDTTALQTVNVAVVGDQPITQLFTTSDLFQVTKTDNDSQAQQLLADEKVDGIITADDQLQFATSSGIPQMILKEAVTQWKQVAALGSAAAYVDFQTPVLKESTTSQSSVTAIFYTVLTSLSFYSAFSGVVIVELLNGSTSIVGRRIGMSAYSKWRLLSQCFLTVAALHVVLEGGLLVYMTQVLGLDLLTNVPVSLLLLVLTVLSGIAIGMVIGNIGRLNQNWRIVLVIILNLALSAAAGMMSYGMRRAVNLVFPHFNEWNPMAIVSSALYRVNVLGDTSSALPLVGILCFYAFMALAVACLLLRKNRYHSLAV